MKKCLAILSLAILVSTAGLSKEPQHRFVNDEAKRLQIASDYIGRANYVGDDENIARVFKQYSQLFDLENFVAFDENADTVPLADRYERLYKNRDEIKHMIASLESLEMKNFLNTLVDDVCLNVQIRLEPDSIMRNKLYDRIDQNSWIGVYNFLPQWKLERSLPQADYDGDMTPYGLAFIDSINARIKDEAVRNALLANCAIYVLDWGKTANVDDFWIPFKEFAGADNPVVKRYESKVEAIKRTKKGNRAIDVEFNDKTGKTIKLSDLYGKVLYIDIWATWCGPCRKEIPFVEKHVAHYRDNDKVRFVSISFDEDSDEWLSLLAKDKPEWEQYITTPPQHEALSKAYGISGIPRFIIINADGTLYDAEAFRPSDPNFINKLNKVINSQK